MSELEKRKPDFTLRGTHTLLSVWISKRGLKLSITRKVENRFEKVDSYTIPLSTILSTIEHDEEMMDLLKEPLTTFLAKKIVKRDRDIIDILRDHCLMIERLAEEEVEESKEESKEAKKE